MRAAFGDAFEIYIRVMRTVERRVHAFFGWDGPDWRPLNACRACCYKLEDEANIGFSRIMALDGNSSLKRVATATNRVTGDERVLDDSSYFLSRAYVDKYAREVRGRQVKNPPVPSTRDADASSDEEEGNDQDSESVDGDPTDGSYTHLAIPNMPTPLTTAPDANGVDGSADMSLFSPPGPAETGVGARHCVDTSMDINNPVAAADTPIPAVSHGPSFREPDTHPTHPHPTPSDEPQLPDASAPAASASEQTAVAQKLLEQCVKNWKAASSEEKKKMWAMFDESGLFASACRHGFVLWLVDMVRSGELAKYPLAIVAKILDTMEPNWMLGYDIGCSFSTTVNNSSLGPTFRAKNGRMCVPSFHGYTHSHICQLHFHPSHIPHTGIEDCETCERIFSGSNQLAPVTRYASAYRRALYIEDYFKQWDEDKLLLLGDFIYNNYRQSLQMIAEETVALESATQSHAINEELMRQWAEDERQIFGSLGEESEQDIRAAEYVELLQQLQRLDPLVTGSFNAFIHWKAPKGSKGYNQEISATQRLEAARRHARDQHQLVTFELAKLETIMGIHTRWQPVDPAYQDAAKYLHQRKYHKALDKLQKLVVQRLFELDKLNATQTAYKMRTQLSKSLKVRCKAIRRALRQYNEAAAELNPLRPALDWEKVSHYVFLEEFDLLKDTRDDIRKKPWAQQIVRKTLKSYRNLCHAKEELSRLNQEIQRTHTAIVDEDLLFRRAIGSLNETDPFRGAVLDFAQRRTAINARILHRIHQTYKLPGFTGTRKPGKAKNNMNTACDFGGSATPILAAPLLDTQSPSDGSTPDADADDEDWYDDDEEGLDDETGDAGDVLSHYIAELAL